MLQSLPQRHPKAPAAPFTTRAPTPASQSIQSSFRLSFSPTGIPSVNLAQSPELQNQTQQKTEEAARAVAQAEHKAASAEDSTAADERDSVSARKNCAWPETRSAMGALEACSAEDQPGEAQLASSPADDSWAASKPHDTALQASADAVASHRSGMPARASAAAVSKAWGAASCEADAVSKLARHIQPALVDTVQCSSSSRTAGSSMETVDAAMHGSTIVSEQTLSQPGQEQGCQPPAGILGPAVTHPAGEAGSMHAAASATASATTNRPEAVLLQAHQTEGYEALSPVSQAQTLAAQPSDNTSGLSAAGQAADLSGSHSSSSLEGKLSHPSHSLLPPSTPMLAWLNALASPGSAAVPEQTPLLSTPASPQPPEMSPMPLPDQATPKLSHQAASAASPVHARIQTGSLTPHPLLKADQIISPMGATLLRPQVGEICSAQTSLGAVPNQATSAPGQTGLLSGVLSSRAAADQATPDAWPRQATPALGLSTGLSRLTTPPSAAEMHRYAAVLPHRLNYFLKLCTGFLLLRHLFALFVVSVLPTRQTSPNACALPDFIQID